MKKPKEQPNEEERQAEAAPLLIPGLTSEQWKEIGAKMAHERHCASLRPGHMVGGIIIDGCEWRSGVIEVKSPCDCIQSRKKQTV